MEWHEYPRDPALDAYVALLLGPARVLVRRGYEAAATRLVNGTGTVTGTVSGGRSRHPLIELPDGERLVVRRYLRGGAVRHVSRSSYLVGHRSFEETRITEVARAAGVRVPVVVAAVEERRRVGYGAMLATRWIPGSQELARWLARGEDGARVMESAGAEVGRMHRGGVSHPDLNLRNFLVSEVVGATTLHLIDFDRARHYPSGVPEWRRRADLRRLARSARKLTAPLGRAEWEAFRAGYGAGWPGDFLFE